MTALLTMRLLYMLMLIRTGLRALNPDVLLVVYVCDWLVAPLHTKLNFNQLWLGPLRSTEAEFMAAYDAGKMILFVRSILWDLGIPQEAATILY